MYTSVGWVWAYFLALFALPIGILGYWLSILATRREIAASIQPSPAQRALAVAAKWSNLLAFLASFIALVITIASN
jgi:hypothetical protein